MTADLIDARGHAKALKDEVRMDLERLCQADVTCGLDTVVVSSDHLAQAHERRLRRVAKEFGVSYRHYWLRPDATVEAVVRVARQLNADPAVYGTLVFRPAARCCVRGRSFPGAGAGQRHRVSPLGKHRSTRPWHTALRVVHTGGLGVSHSGWLAGRGRRRPARLLPRSIIVVVGRSNDVGKPTVSLGYFRNAVVVSCDERGSRTRRLAQHTRQAPLLVVAARVCRASSRRTCLRQRCGPRRRDHPGD